MKQLFTFVLLLSSFISYSQFGNWGGKKKKSIKGKIEGVLIDSMTNATISFATITMKRGDTNLDGVLSEENGSWKIGEVTTGKYDLYISFLGYKEKVIRDVETTLKDPDVNLNTIYLVPSSVILDGVKITEKRALIENKPDKLVFNAEDDSSIAGGDATDVLRKVPLLSVDLEGNVSLRGSQNVRILINGKPSGMFSSNVADALKMFPADQIKKVEVITSPGAKYDGEGSGGIINIITKRTELEGLAGSINASAGNRQNNAFVNINAGKGRFGLTANSSVFYSVPADGINEFLRTADVPGGQSEYIQEGNTKTSRLGFNGSLSAFYDLNAYNAFNSSFSLRGFGFDTDASSTATLNDPTNIIMGEVFDDKWTRLNKTETLNSGFDWSTDYTRKFEDDEVKELTMAFQLSGNVQNQDYDLVEDYNLFNILDRSEQVNNDGDNLETTVQIDYVQPLPKSIKLEVGAKGILRDITSDYKFNVLDESSGQYQLDSTRSNVFDYDQDVVSGYASLNYTLGKFGFITGLRVENTQIKGDDLEGGVFENDYQSYLPSFTVSRSLSNFRQLKLSYSKRIQRPNLRFINPFNNSADLFNRTEGNPFLNPEITHQVELSYNFNVFGAMIYASPYYKRTDDVIEQVLLVENGVSTNTYKNIAKSESYGINLFTSKSIKKLTARVGGNVYSYSANGFVNGVERERDAILYQIFWGGDYSFTGNFKSDFFGFFRSPNATLQGETPSFWIYGFGFRYDFKKSSLGLKFIDPFNATKSFNSEQVGPGFYQKNDFAIPFRSIGINFRYKFGKVDFKKRKSKIKNTDLKKGDDAGQGGGGQGGMGQGN